MCRIRIQNDIGNPPARPVFDRESEHHRSERFLPVKLVCHQERHFFWKTGGVLQPGLYINKRAGCEAHADVIVSERFCVTACFRCFGRSTRLRLIAIQGGACEESYQTFLLSALPRSPRGRATYRGRLARMMFVDNETNRLWGSGSE